MVGGLRVQKIQRLCGLLLSLFSLSFAIKQSQASSLSANLNTAIGANLDQTNRQTSLTLTPNLTYAIDEINRIIFGTIIDRPFDAYKQFEIPTFSLRGSRSLNPQGALDPQATLAFTALSLDKLGTEGLSLRTCPGLGLTLSPLSIISLSVRLGPYFILSQYNQFANGEPKPKYGINEIIAASLVFNSWKLEMELIIDQAYTTFWRNNYSSSQSIDYQFAKSMSLGVSHSLLSSVVNDSTGFYRTVQVFDTRRSRISMFLNVGL